MPALPVARRSRAELPAGGAPRRLHVPVLQAHVVRVGASVRARRGLTSAVPALGLVQLLPTLWPAGRPLGAQTVAADGARRAVYEMRGCAQGTGGRQPKAEGLLRGGDGGTGGRKHETVPRVEPRLLCFVSRRNETAQFSPPLSVAPDSRCAFSRICTASLNPIALANAIRSK